VSDRTHLGRVLGYRGKAGEHDACFTLDELAVQAFLPNAQKAT
jgi:hypothetical protein